MTISLGLDLDLLHGIKPLAIALFVNNAIAKHVEAAIDRRDRRVNSLLSRSSLKL